ncbi:MAG: YqeG family HAD IIIA-type phosphatase [Thermoguttaceae bacterium]|nr:YqeG family HAD IIIA-type phosphatase [Thermoguttaceae bacterium]MDW8038768.1 YqeG family HAD IIIA-type phosphatase [Thermoguttaceae bacterium]
MGWWIPRLVVPDLRIERIEELTAPHLAALEVQALLVDVDCTLCRYQQEDIPAEKVQWIQRTLQGGWQVCLVSNGRAGRIARLAQQLHVPFVAGALKPFSFGCRRALRKLGLPASKAAMVGDQLFADVLAARWLGMKSVLVRPIHPEDEPWFTRMKRPLEGWVLKQLEKDNLRG